MECYGALFSCRPENRAITHILNSSREYFNLEVYDAFLLTAHDVEHRVVVHLEDI